MLHQANLGVFKTLMDVLQEMSKELNPNPVSQLDERIMTIKESEDFLISGCLDHHEEDILHWQQILQPLNIVQ